DAVSSQVVRAVNEARLPVVPRLETSDRQHVRFVQATIPDPDMIICVDRRRAGGALSCRALATDRRTVGPPPCARTPCPFPDPDATRPRASRCGPVGSWPASRREPGTVRTPPPPCSAPRRPP